MSFTRTTVSLKEGITIGLVFVSVIMSVISALTTSQPLIVLSMTLTFIGLFMYCFTNLQKHFVLAIMLLCIFTFLASSVIVRYILGQSNYSYGLSSSDFATACSLIIISVIMIFMGYIPDKHISLKKKRRSILEDESYSIERIQRLAFILFVILSFAELFFSVPRMFYAMSNGYISLYTSYTGSVWITRLSFMASATFFIGLAARPDKKRAKWYAIIGIINPLVVLIQGERGTIVTYVLFMTYYFFTYNNFMSNTDESNNTKTLRLVFIAIISALIVLPALYKYGLSRIGESDNTRGLIGLARFFDSQGGSFRILGASIKYKGDLPQKWYSFGSIIDRFSNLSVSGQGEQLAMSGHSFADIITYLEEKWSYLSGYGMGSSYIAEIFYDFGIVGVAIVNLLLGRVLKILSRYKDLSVFKRSILFILFQNMMIMPRGAFLRPIDVLLSSSTIIIFIVIFGFSKVRIST